LTAEVEGRSEHHLAGAIIQKAFDEKIPLDTITYEEFEALTGRGVKAKINGTTYVVGNHDLIEEQGICSPAVEDIIHRFEREGKTVVVIGTETAVLGIIAVEDQLREESSNIVRQLHAEGVKKVIMVTGDNAVTAEAMAGRIGIDEFHAGILPEEKAARIKQLREQHNGVIMVGDGINDAPALAASTVGIAMGDAGTDVALETADVVLMSDDLSKIPYIMSLSRKTLSIIKQNIVIALVTKLVFLFLGVCGLATLWTAVLADDGAAIIVILNGLRLLGFRSGERKRVDDTGTA
jgi:Cd2+/Zn2+-exporting ATPase